MPKTGRPRVPNSKRNQVSIRLTLVEFTELVMFAKAENMSMAAYLRRAMSESFAKERW